MTTTLAEMRIGNPSANVGTSGLIRYYASKEFITLEGIRYKAGVPGSADYFMLNSWTKVGTDLVVPERDLFPSTMDAKPATSRISAYIYDADGNRRGSLFENFQIPATAGPHNLLFLQALNSRSFPVRNSETLSKADFLLALDNLVLDQGFAPINSPPFTGTPTAPTQATADSSTKLATTAFVQAVAAALVGAAPDLLNTLAEIAAQLQSDEGALVTSLALKAPITPSINAQTGASYSLQASDNGKIVTFSGACVVTVPAGLGAGFNCLLIAIGAGTVSFVASGTTINHRQGHTTIAGQFGEASLKATAANVFNLGGDTAA